MRVPFLLRWSAVAVLVLSFTAAFAFTRGSEVKVDCGPAVHYSPTYAGIKHAEDWGTVAHGLIDGDVSFADTYRLVKGTFDTIELWWAVFRAAALGEDTPKLATRWQDQQEADAQTAVAACCPGIPQTGGAPTAGAFSPASLDLTPGETANLTGEELLRQVAMKFWPADQVPTAVAVGMAESSGNPKAHNDYGQGVDGLWQINRQAHPELVAGKNLQDPVVNGALAFQIWKQAGDSWQPWSTWTSGAYKRYLRPTSTITSMSTTPPGGGSNAGTGTGAGSGIGPRVGRELGKLLQPKPKVDSPVIPSPGPGTQANGPQQGCASGAMPPLRIVTWNSYCGPVYPAPCGTDPARGNARVVKAMRSFADVADVIAGQEFSDPSRRAAASAALGDGWAVAGGDTSHPIWVRKDAFTITGQDAPLVLERHQELAGPPQGARWAVEAQLQSTATGQTVTIENMHQLPKIQKGKTLRDDWGSRVDAAEQYWTVVLNKARAAMTRGAVVVAGDMNYDGDPGGMYAAAGLTQASTLFQDPGTRRGRDIDQLLFSAGMPSSMLDLGKHGSDHNARLLTFTGQTASSPAAANLSAAVGGGGVQSVTDPTSGKTYQIQMPTDPRRAAAMRFAIAQLGKPYVWAARGPNSYDCSGLMHAAFKSAGIDVYPQTETLVRQFAHVSVKQPGDMLYHPGHVQMFMGVVDGQDIILEAPRPGRDVTIRPQWGSVTAILDPTRPTS